jgi:hypothetical protein
MKPEYINGPTNYAYLKGNLNGIEKEIHIFFDKHFNLDKQTKCESFNSIDITYYLYRLINESKGPLDFFMEIGIEQLEDKNISNKKDIYMREVVDLFRSEFAFNKNNDLDMNLFYSKTNSNTRLHYFDIRDHMDIFFLTRIINRKIVKYINLFDKTESDKKKCIEKILFYTEQISMKIELLNSNMKEVIADNVRYDKINNKQKYYLDKIINQYANNNLKKNLNIFLNIHCGSILSDIANTITIIRYIFTKDTKDINSNELQNHIDKLGEYILQLYSFCIDVYLLRRILDKNYIKKCIIYSGGAHSVNVVYFLVKYCNFQIVKIQKNKEKDIQILSDKILNQTYSFGVYDSFYIKNTSNQCIRMESLGIDDMFLIDI